MRTLSFWLCLFLLFPLLHAQDAELKMYQDELARALRLKNRDSIAAAYCHLGEYYAYRQSVIKVWNMPERMYLNLISPY